VRSLLVLSLLLPLAAPLACAPPSGRPDGGPANTDSGAPQLEPEPDAGPPAPVHLQIRIDTRYDTYGWVTPERRAVLEEAAAIWGRLLTDDFPAVPAGTPILLRHPEAPGAPAMEAILESPADDITIFVAAAAFDGRGGAAAASFPTATFDVDDATLSDELAARWDGSPFRPWTGWISFDVAERWYTDPTPRTDVNLPPDELDLLSTAIHEIGHILGFGSAPAFHTLVDDDGRFAGEQAVALFGGPVPLTNDASHFPDGLVSDDGRALMDLSDPEGQRFFPTALDLAVLADLGYTLAP